MAKKKNDSEELNEFVIKGILEKKGKDIVVMDLHGIHNAICDFFIICHGTSSIHIKAIVDSIEEKVRKFTGLKVWHKEGLQNSEWILLDYFDVIVHVFLEQNRSFYSLEDLWADAEITRVE